MLIIPSYFWIIWISVFLLHFFYFICHTFILQMLSKYLTMSPEEIFFMDFEKPFTFFMVERVYKLTITIYCHLITDPFSSYIFINFLFIWKFWIKFLDFLRIVVLSSLILCIRISDLAYEKEDKIITFTKFIVLQFYHIFCFSRFYSDISLLECSQCFLNMSI